MFVFWGGNRENYFKSDFHFKDDDFDFTSYNVQAKDKPLDWKTDHINPTKIIIVQTNFITGYYGNNHYNILLGLDQLKYMMNQNQIAHIDSVVGSCYLDSEGTYLPTGNNKVNLTDGSFLKFEHPDGLNYINTEFCRVDDLSKWLKLPNSDKFQLNSLVRVSPRFYI